MYFRWKTTPLALIESSYISLSGFSSDVSMAAVFVFLTAGTRREDTAIASGAFYLAHSLGEVMGFAAGNSVLLVTLGRSLRVRLREVDRCDEVCGVSCVYFILSPCVLFRTLRSFRRLIDDLGAVMMISKS